MKHTDCYSVAEAAIVLGTSEDTVHIRQARGRIGCEGPAGLVPRADVELLVNSPVRKATFEYARSIDLGAVEAPLTPEEQQAFRELFTD